MPHVSLRISPNGPLLQFLVSASGPRNAALAAAGQPAIAAVPITGLIDTGASLTSIDCAVIQQLAIPSTGKVPLHTPSTQAGAPHLANLYDISLVLVHPMIARTFRALPVTESHLAHQGIQALIGRDILAHCLLTYDGVGQNFCLAF